MNITGMKTSIMMVLVHVLHHRRRNGMNGRRSCPRLISPLAMMIYSPQRHRRYVIQLSLSLSLGTVHVY